MGGPRPGDVVTNRVVVIQDNVSSVLGGTTLDRNDYVFLQVRNNTGANDVTAELDGSVRVEER